METLTLKGGAQHCKIIVLIIDRDYLIKWPFVNSTLDMPFSHVADVWPINSILPKGYR